MIKCPLVHGRTFMQVGDDLQARKACDEIAGKMAG
jgi:hypothetical protein